ncbi:ISLre2 family transposase [Aeribacillus alveayuensis]|uniref:House-cleaning noncanonical NTP pyrophosphatase (MazG superfamily) n=1 Tax=Aeribacillus alveayuensis TaxID=279215 RepID=A0ABT9VSL0_9BACI|nr:putative house-cleaning noncanonical NTP pyrophosphatase (MazG superfamily) [Bacillus alveayuensis]
MRYFTEKFPSLKELEQGLFLLLQQTFGKVFKEILEEIDREIAESRDKKRFQMKDKREVQLDTAFGTVSFKRNYYYDREAKQYVCLLDQFLQFKGGKGFSPLLEEWVIELAATGPSYRNAVRQIETLLGYQVMSHEALRQHLLQCEVMKPTEKMRAPRVLFVEVDGLHTKRQGKRKKGKEEKIAAVHMGWQKNGKRVSLIQKRHYHHKGNEPFWEGFETFLEEHYDYDATETKLIINGDGAKWIRACQDYFQGQCFYCLDRFHVAKAIRELFRNHPRYREIRVALSEYHPEKLLVELTSAVGQMQTEEKEEKLEDLIELLTENQQAITDYRKWLEEQGIETKGMRPMGSAEATMSVFSKRLKGGRSWSEMGIQGLIDAFIAVKDGLSIRTLKGLIEPHERKEQQKKKVTHMAKKYQKKVEAVTRNNIHYLQRSSGTPIYHALKAMVGF